jgi:histidinol-phosphatase (PHP family)
MEEYVLAAIGHGLKEIIFLEHMEEGIESERVTWLSDADFQSYFNEGERLQRRYGDRITIGMGVECGYNPDCGEELRRRLLARPWAQIGLSCHFLRTEEASAHLNLFSRNPESLRLARAYGPDRLLSQYFANLTEAVETLPGTKVCHLDGALRFLAEISLSESHYRQIDHLLHRMQARGLALELNTSGLTIRGEIFPNRRILARARELGLALVLGSDAHRPQEVAGHFHRLDELLA